ncbi:MAG: phytoene desaturase family protein [Candidatus Kapaibacterium sp.]
MDEEARGTEMNRVAVIGAGLGGLSAALHLRALGYDVEIFEKNSRAGGKLGRVENEGFTFPTGPTILTMPDVLQGVFDFAGQSKKMPEILPLEIISHNFFESGHDVRISADPGSSMRSIAEVSPDDAGRYEDYLAYSKSIYDNGADVFLFEPFQEIPMLYKTGSIPSLSVITKIDAFRTAHKANREYFRHPNIIKIFDRYATYSGSDPYRAPATLNIIAHVELNMGGFYVVGGMYEIVRSLVQACAENDIRIHTESPVEKIAVNNGRVYGVYINDRIMECDRVICNADPVYAFDKLIDGYDSRTRKLKAAEPSISGVLFMWGVRSKSRSLGLHNVFFAEDYRDEFRAIFDRGRVYGDPTIYVSISSKADPDHAPDDCENWYVLVNAPYMRDGGGFEDINIIRRNILNKLQRFGYDIDNRIVYEDVITPVDILDLYNSNRGSIYGMSSNSKMAAFRRQSNRSNDIDGLYFAGGAAHPGGGVPLTLLSGRHCARIIAFRDNKEFRVNI